MGIKRCNRCGLEQEEDQFPFYDSGTHTGFRNFCAPCLLLKKKEYRDRNQARVYANTRNSMLRHRYGISAVDYDLMFAEQSGKCAICGTDTPTRTGRRRMLNGDSHPFHVDHNHETGGVRGLLCPSCNKALGLLGEHNLEAALAYVQFHNEKENSHR